MTLTIDPARAALLSADMTIGIIRNPRSHRNKRETDPPVSSARLIVATPATRPAIKADLAAMKQAGVGLIVADGGDGTVRDILTQGADVFGENWPRLMVVPKGKTNALALDLGMPGRITVQDALAQLPNARIVQRHALRIEPAYSGKDPVFGFILGTGVFNAAIDAAQVTHRLGAFQGLAVGLTVAAGTLMTVLGLGNGPWRQLWPTRIVAADGVELPHSRYGRAGERWVAGFSTLTRFPLGMKPFAAMGGGTTGQIACIAVDAPLRRVVARAPAILAGAGGPGYTALGVHRATSAQWTADLGSRFILDGEAFGPGQYRIGLGPLLDFVVP